MKPETIAIHVPNRKTNGSIAPAINLSTTFEHGPANESLHGYIYSREDNPNVDDLEQRLAALEGGIGALAFGSGMAAVAAVLGTLPRGSTVLFHTEIYFAVKLFAETILPDCGLRPERIDMRDAGALNAALSEDISLVWIESPTNPTMALLDIQQICAAAHGVGAKVLIDGSFAPPVIQRPLAMGVDYVLHALTKYIGGHSDVQGGAVIVRENQSDIEALYQTRKLTGGVLSPFNAWLASRGLQTLHCRVDRHCANALQVAQWLETHPNVAKVRYPFLPSNPGYSLAQRQMSAGGGMLAFDVKGGGAAALNVASKVKLFVNATSFGGVESLIEHRASVEGDATATPKELLRLSIGLENPIDLIADLEQALG